MEPSRLAGSWIGIDERKSVASLTLIPLDPAGNTAAVRGHIDTYSQGTADQFTQLGADSMSDFSGQMVKTSHNTFAFTVMGYASM